MNHTKTLYTISPIKQLVDLNHAVVNFACRIRITSLDQKSFEAVVVSDTDLQTRDTWPFERDQNGTFSGDIRITKNVPEPYYLMLRAPEPRTVEVVLELEPLPDFISQNNGIVLESGISALSDTVQQHRHWMWIGGAAIAIAGLSVAWQRGGHSGASPGTTGARLIPRANQSLLTQLKSMSETVSAPPVAF